MQIDAGPLLGTRFSGTASTVSFVDLDSDASRLALRIASAKSLGVSNVFNSVSLIKVQGDSFRPTFYPAVAQFRLFWTQQIERFVNLFTERCVRN